ncbi:hypothetical protein PV325_014009 [Microctonus aethiopoides]|nr:hypothetical protein PV325_014009 [Microctonus aethiopoides]
MRAKRSKRGLDTATSKCIPHTVWTKILTAHCALQHTESNEMKKRNIDDHDGVDVDDNDDDDEDDDDDDDDD